MESLRRYLGVKKWLLFGNSWGSTLSLAYGQAHPDKCLGFILSGIFLGTKENFEHLWYGMRDTYPEAFDEFNSFLPENERGDLINFYLKRVMDPDHEISLPAAKAFLKYDLICSLALQPPPWEILENNDLVLNVARGFAHYGINKFFLKPNQLIKNMYKIAHLPSIIVHGRYDSICKVSNAYELHKKWQGSELIIVQDAGHAHLEPPMAKALKKSNRENVQSPSRIYYLINIINDKAVIL